MQWKGRKPGNPYQWHRMLSVTTLACNTPKHQTSSNYSDSDTSIPVCGSMCLVLLPNSSLHSLHEHQLCPPATIIAWQANATIKRDARNDTRYHNVVVLLSVLSNARCPDFGSAVVWYAWGSFGRQVYGCLGYCVAGSSTRCFLAAQGLEQFLSQMSQIDTGNFEFDTFCYAKFSVVASILCGLKRIWANHNQHQSTLPNSPSSLARRAVNHWSTFSRLLFANLWLSKAGRLNMSQSNTFHGSFKKWKRASHKHAMPRLFAPFSGAQEQGLKCIQTSSIRTFDDLCPIVTAFHSCRQHSGSKVAT